KKEFIFIYYALFFWKRAIFYFQLKKKLLGSFPKKESQQPKGVSMRFNNEHPQAPQGSKKGVKRLVV
ncbi:hypothetical protein BWK59_15000, partial [Flavobacterium davisii]